MCGIAGILHVAPPKPVDLGELRRLNDGCAHRGPDDSGEWSGANVALAHRRLSIIDRSSRGHQPMLDPSGRVAVTYNGEIYNFEALKTELQQRGHAFTSASDTEVLIRGYLEWGLEGVLTRANGMFAFLLYDRERRRVYACRDRFGEKPLYYYRDPMRVVFSSEIRALASVCRGLSLDPEALDYYLSELSVPQPRTIWREIRQVPPAHYASFGLDAPEEPTIVRYWSLRQAPKLGVGEAEALALVEKQLSSAVVGRTIGDRPVGAFLSGGVDSGLVVAMLARSGAGRVKTFAMGFAGAEGSELADARLVAERYGTDHTEIVVEPRIESVLDRLVDAFGEPFADPSSLATYYVCREIASSVTVAISGDGGDEVFGGYYEYGLAYWADRLRHLPAWQRKAARWTAGVRRRLGLRAPPYGSADAFFTAPASARLYRQMGFDPARKANLYARAWREARPDFAWRRLDEAWRASERADLTDTLFAASLDTRLLNDYLVKVDRASMLHSIEVRSPFLDRDLVELAARLPADLKLKDGTPKYLLRVLAERHVSPGSLTRPKRGFSLPIGAWLRNELRPLVNEYLLGERIAARGMFSTGYVRSLVEEHVSGARDHTHRIWALLCLELWLERVADRVPASGSSEAAVSR
jgi:asparagine synthase (glutamine-hydrolysing)